MTTVSEILAMLNLNRRDLNNVSLSQLETIFNDLTVKEISILCAVNRRFNTVCENESFWRNKISRDYGIHKKYGDTWRKTARNMDKINMINLDGVWFDGRTYRKILDDALQNGVDVFRGLQEQYLLPYVDNDEDDALFIIFEVNDEKTLQNFANTFLDRPYTDDELDDILLINSVEIKVIYSAVRAYEGVKGRLPGDVLGTVSQATQSYEFLREMIDPILYVMQFSSFPRNKLDVPYKE
uniref:F-box family protein n=1 Tax=Pithovirus LCPAC403 TaxID=2506596 RepID=A0A481ZBT2_9VIRU|nr:MAG: F-box family protein [Pithovirus LCPAC403]